MQKNLHEMTAQEKAEHFKRINLEILERKATGRYELNADESIAMFREEGKPKIDFYLTKGRWRVVGYPDPRPMVSMRSPEGKDVRGAKWFLIWYGGKE